jgi:hypothetical protein
MNKGIPNSIESLCEGKGRDQCITLIAWLYTGSLPIPLKIYISKIDKIKCRESICSLTLQKHVTDLTYKPYNYRFRIAYTNYILLD